MNTSDVLAVIVVLAGGWGLYLLRCWTHPFGPCRSCKGRRGRKAGSTRRSWGRCRACGGSGERLRWGARLTGRRDQ